jgi:hypothetical protein
MSSEYDDEYEYRPQSGLSTKSSQACSLLAVPRTRTRTQRSGTRTRRLFGLPSGTLSSALPPH